MILAVYTQVSCKMPSVQQVRGLLGASSTVHQRRLGLFATTSVATFRTHHQTAILRQPYKDDQDRESLKPRAQESSKSTSDEDAAHDDAAFDPNQTKPETAKDKGSQKPDGSPLEVSPANQDVSKPKAGAKEMMGGGDTSDKKKRSGGGSSE